MTTRAWADEEPPLLESWYRDHLSSAKCDISSSGVQPYSFGELRSLTGLTAAELDAVVLEDGTSYGSPALRAAIAGRYCDGDASRVMVTHGSSEAIALALAALVRPGDRVAVLEPIYHSLARLPRMFGAELVPLPLAAFDDGEPDETSVRRAVTPGTAAVVVTFPHNPTGVTLTRRGYDTFVELVAEAGASLVWDGAMSELTYGAEPLPSPVASSPRNVSFGTLSKAYGLPGLRVGWCIASPEVLAGTLAMRDSTTLFLSPLVELVATKAVLAASTLISRRLAQARRNLELVDRWVEEHDGLVRWRRPQGGVCGLLELPTVADTRALCHELLDRHETILVPGDAFGRPDGVRLGFGGDPGELERGLEALSAVLTRR